MRVLLIGIFICLSISAVQSQDVTPDYARFNAGIGLGLDYGGFGAKLNYLPLQRLALFGGVGYNYLEVGYNVGATVRFLPDRAVTPTLSGMYGYNRTIRINGTTMYNKTYYGSSFGGGVEIRTRKNPRSLIILEILIPIESQSFTDDYNAIRSNPSIRIPSYLPVSFTVGYQFEF